MRVKGTIRSWNDQRGFGFIESSSGGKDVFLHVSALTNRNRRPENGQLVTYTLATDARGRPTAQQVKLPGDSVSRKRSSKRSSGAWLVSGAFLFLIVAFAFLGWLPLVVAGAYVGLSLVTYFVYAYDKVAAKDGAWRTSEGTLHWLSVLGGWPGALVAQQSLRHKSRKKSFRFAFWITLVLNLVGLFWLMSPHGADFFYSRGL